jgi:hypothetical protein
MNTLGKKNKIGLVLCGLLGLADIASLAAIPGSTDSDEPGPPVPVLLAGAALGVVTLVGVVYTWRTGNRIGARVVSGARILSALGAMPAFFVEDVSAGLVLTAGLLVVVTLVAVGLTLARPSRVTVSA